MRRRKPLREKRRKSKTRNKLICGIVAVGLILVCFLIYSSLYPKDSSSNDQTGPPKAALVDHLSFSSPPPNSTFQTQCRTILENTGFNYTYYEGEKVTVDFYKKLPTYGYSLIVLRVHSAVIEDDQGIRTNLIGLFTSEVFNETTKSIYLPDLENGRLALAKLFVGRNDTYFGITPFFVQSNMVGSFKNTVIIMMGCEGLNHTSMAEALVQRGAKVYISWTGLVTKSHTDDATSRLLQSLQQNQTIKTAVEGISFDPNWRWSKLNYYPNEGDEDVGNKVLHDFVGDLTP